MDFDLYNKQENSTGVNEQGMSIQNKQLFSCENKTAQNPDFHGRIAGSSLTHAADNDRSQASCKFLNHQFVRLLALRLFPHPDRDPQLAMAQA